MGAHIINVEPRYTPGSPASVDALTAEHVAREEAEAYEFALKGYSGELDKNTAQTIGLRRIVFEMVEVPKGWWVYDWLTKEMHWWPFVGDCQRCGRKKVRARRGWLEDHGSCSKGATYVGRIANEDERLTQGRRFFKEVS